jgi:hypothetical protein
MMMILMAVVVVLVMRERQETMASAPLHQHGLQREGEEVDPPALQYGKTHYSNNKNNKMEATAKRVKHGAMTHRNLKAWHACCSTGKGGGIL